jgi:hypothetical protein
MLLAGFCMALVGGGCGGSFPESGATTAPTAAAKADGLPELTSIGQLQRAFDAHPGVPRLVILLSPT